MTPEAHDDLNGIVGLATIDIFVSEKNSKTIKSKYIFPEILK